MHFEFVVNSIHEVSDRLEDPWNLTKGHSHWKSLLCKECGCDDNAVAQDGGCLELKQVDIDGSCWSLVDLKHVCWGKPHGCAVEY